MVSTTLHCPDDPQVRCYLFTVTSIDFGCCETHHRPKVIMSKMALSILEEEDRRILFELDALIMSRDDFLTIDPGKGSGCQPMNDDFIGDLRFDVCLDPESISS